MKDESSWYTFFKDASIEEEFATTYAKEFVKNRIQFETLHALKMAELQLMGITAVGHCLCILDHARNFKQKYRGISFCLPMASIATIFKQPWGTS